MSETSWAVVQQTGKPSGWRTVQLGEAIEVNPRRDLTQGTEAPFVAMADMLEHHRLLPPLETREYRGGGSRFRNGDTLLARITPCLENGKTARVSGLSEGETGHGSTEFIVLSAREDVTDSQFIYYVARSPHFRSYAIGQMTGTSGRQRVPIDAVKSFVMPLPPPPEQRSIAGVLGALDDKIEQNRQTAEALGRLMRATFRAWFVDFEPVKAKAAGADFFPSMPLYVFDSLPTRFVDSEIGPVPEGWHSGFLGDVIDIHDSQRVPLSRREREQRSGLFRYYGATGIIDYVNDFLFDGLFVLVGEDGTVVNDQGGPVVQYVWGKFWVNNHAHVLTGSNGISTEYLRVLLDHIIIRPFVTGAVQPKLNQRNLKSVPIVVPPPEATTAFNDIIAPLFAWLREAQDQSRLLESMRNLLLPQLLSGQFRVEVADG